MSLCTGFDNVSSFYENRNKTALIFKLLLWKSDIFQVISSLGSGKNVAESEVTAATSFVGTLYAKTDCKSLIVLC